jgi:imidazolonepropionase-like amidohydrolase
MRLRRLIVLLAAFVASTVPALAETIYVRAGHLVDPERGVVLERQMLRIEDGRVAAVMPDGPVPDGAKLVDWSAFWVLPGMIDMHVHLADVEQTSSYA